MNQSMLNGILAGAVATVAFDFFGQSLSPLLGFASLAPVPLANNVIQTLTGAPYEPAAQLLHYIAGMIAACDRRRCGDSEQDEPHGQVAVVSFSVHDVHVVINAAASASTSHCGSCGLTEHRNPPTAVRDSRADSDVSCG